MSYTWDMVEELPLVGPGVDEDWDGAVPEGISAGMRRFVISMLVLGVLSATFLILLVAVFAKPQFFQNLPEPWCLPFPCDRG